MRIIGYYYKLVFSLLRNLLNITKNFGNCNSIFLVVTYVTKLFGQFTRFIGYNKPINNNQDIL